MKKEVTGGFVECRKRLQVGLWSVERGYRWVC